MRFLNCIIIIIGLITELCFCKPVRTGLDNISSYQHIFQNKRIGIIANHTACNSNSRFILDIFRQMPDVKVTALFGPEHGFEGIAEAGKKIDDSLSDSNIPIYSLYGKNNQPSPEMLKNVDVLVFDIQDIGCRYYTYIYTMALAMEAAARDGKLFVVLDRPNPINGISVQGNVLDTEFATFVGLYPIAARYGMTVGELAKMFNSQGWLKGTANLIVVPMTNYKRSLWYDQTGLKFIKPSPNMPSLDAALMYAGTCLFEGTNVSEGRGTNNPFLLFGAPWIDSAKLTAELNKLKLSGVKFTEKQFTPTSSKYQNQTCFGSQILITNRNRTDSFWCGVVIIDTIFRMYPENFQWKEKHFDRLCGTDTIRKTIAERKPLKQLKNQWKNEINEFLKIRKNYLLY